MPIVYWEWDFGDGNTATGPVVSHVYASPGSMRVKLTVTDQRGYQDAEEKTVNATTPTQPTPIPTQIPPPTPTGQPPTPTSPALQPTPTVAPTQPPVQPPQASIQGPASGYVGEPVTFDASGSTGSGSLTYAWTFGDGASAGPSENPSVRTLYSQPGTYQASVVVTDQSGQSSSAEMSITIGARLDTVVWSLDRLGNQPLVPGIAITLQFLGGQITGFGGCNAYNGGYTATDNGDGTYSVTMSGLTSTGAACPGDVMGQEQNYLAILGSVTGAQIQGNVLTLNSPQGSLTFYQAGTSKPK